jgi:F0F1-type ATP synthase epsilon subunit
MGIVTRHLEVLYAITIDAVRTPKQFEPGKRTGIALQEGFCELDVVEIEVDITADPNELVRDHIDLLGHHRKQGSLLAHIEWIPEPEIV